MADTMRIVAEIEDFDTANMSPTQPYTLIGMDTASPVLKIGDMLWVGTFEDVCGTDLIFERGAPEPPDMPDGPARYACSATKRLRFRRAVLTPLPSAAPSASQAPK
eukprot:m51a1_g1300 hypothetical protein (106) ;mRNA; r:197084-197494